MKLCIFVRTILLLLITFLANSFINSAEIIKGDSQNTNQTFSNPVSVYALAGLGDFLYVGARTAGANSYSIACLPRGEQKFVDLARQKVRINGIEADNPLYNSAITLMTLLGENYRPIVVVAEGQYKDLVFLIDNFSDLEKIEMLSTPALVTPEIKVTSEIIRLAANTTDRGGYAFAAIKNNAGDAFGTVGSAIALLAAHFVDKGEGKQKTSHFSFDQLSATALNTTTEQIRIGNTVAFLADAIDMHWDNTLGCLYAVLQLQSNTGESDGIKALVVGKINNNYITFTAIGPDALFQGTNKIVGATGASKQVNLYNVKTMHTSTGLHYVIVCGGNSELSNTKRYVFSLPLVYNRQKTDQQKLIHGTLAKKDSIPESYFYDEPPYRFISRGFSTAASSEFDTVNYTDSQAIVGVDSTLLSGDIEEIFVKDDAVFVVVPTADSGQRAGVFYSRAFFDEHGRVKGWTEWQRVGGFVQDQTFGAAVDAGTAQMFVLTGTSSDLVKTVQRTEWGYGDNQELGPLVDVLGKTFSRDCGGIHGIYDKPMDNPGLDGISLLIATGYQTVALVQTSEINSEFIPTVGTIFETNKEVFSNGSIDRVLPTGSLSPRVVIISGGVLNQLDFINAAEIAQVSLSSWFFVGGDNGLALLSRNSGISWQSLGSGFSDLQQGTEFKTVGSYRHVRKLIADDNYLYVLTDKKLDRIDLVNSNFATGDLSVVTIASAGQTYGLNARATLFDVIVSEKFGLLATSAGLLRISNDIDIRTVQTAGEWTKVTIPEGCGPVIQLFVSSRTNYERDVARYQGGNVYALVAFVGKKKAQVNRFSVSGIVGAQVSDGTIQSLPDLFIKDVRSFFFNVGNFRDWIVPDGSFFFHEVNRHLCDLPFVCTLWPNAHSGSRFLADKNPVLPITLDNFCFLLPLIRNSATGSWLLAGNDGLRINE